MTRINLHGILAQEYGNQFSLQLAKSSDVIRAIDCNRDGFLHRIGELYLQGFFYDIIVDNQRFKDVSAESLGSAIQIDLVPIIAGAGIIPAVVGVVSSIGGAVVGGIGAAAGAIGGAIGGIGSAFATGGALSGFGGTLIKGVGMALISKALAPKPPVMENPKMADQKTPTDVVVQQTPGASAEAGAAAQSYIFGGRANIAAQGSPVPIGYGRLRVGSNVIQACVKSYPCEMEPVSTMLGNAKDYEADHTYGTSRGEGDAQIIRSTTSIGI